MEIFCIFARPIFHIASSLALQMSKRKACSSSDIEENQTEKTKEKHRDEAPECGICYEVLIEPQVGHCGHSICLLCWYRLDYHGTSLADKGCPLCKKISPWQPNFQLREFIQCCPSYVERKTHIWKTIPEEVIKKTEKVCKVAIEFGPDTTSSTAKILLDFLISMVENKSTSFEAVHSVFKIKLLPHKGIFEYVIGLKQPLFKFGGFKPRVRCRITSTDFILYIRKNAHE